MKNGEVLDANTRGDLVVDNSVKDGGEDTQKKDFQGLHRLGAVFAVAKEIVRQSDSRAAV
jgi:hypothetical protein